MTRGRRKSNLFFVLYYTRARTAVRIALERYQSAVAGFDAKRTRDGFRFERQRVGHRGVPPLVGFVEGQSEDRTSSVVPVQVINNRITADRRRYRWCG